MESWCPRCHCWEGLSRWAEAVVLTLSPLWTNVICFSPVDSTVWKIISTKPLHSWSQSHFSQIHNNVSRTIWADTVSKLIWRHGVEITLARKRDLLFLFLAWDPQMLQPDLLFGLLSAQVSSWRVRRAFRWYACCELDLGHLLWDPESSLGAAVLKTDAPLGLPILWASTSFPSFESACRWESQLIQLSQTTPFSGASPSSGSKIN